ncbi:MAG: hypothetical protein WC333_01310 [Dehalococcoidia bacterium]|jgi:hypothetical protein
MKRIIVKKEHLIEYVERKKAEKVFYEIIGDLHRNAKMLNENVSHVKANQAVIDNYRRRGLVTPMVQEMLVKNRIMSENYEIM